MDFCEKRTASTSCSASPARRPFMPRSNTSPILSASSAPKPVRPLRGFAETQDQRPGQGRVRHPAHQAPDDRRTHPRNRSPRAHRLRRRLPRRHPRPPHRRRPANRAAMTCGTKPPKPTSPVSQPPRSQNPKSKAQIAMKNAPRELAPTVSTAANPPNAVVSLNKTG